MADRPSTRDSLARNVRYLLSRAGWSERDLATRAGVSQRTVNNIRNGSGEARISSVDAVAAVFGLTSWHLIMPNLPEDLIDRTDLDQLVRAYIESSPDGRDMISKVAEREAQYGTGKTP